jgi:hypothetical protein
LSRGCGLRSIPHIIALEAEAKAEAPSEDAEPRPSPGMTDHGRPRRAQRNVTDPDSRVMTIRGDSSKAQRPARGRLGASDHRRQRLTTSGSDQAGLVPLLDGATGALGYAASATSRALSCYRLPGRSSAPRAAPIVSSRDHVAAAPGWPSALAGSERGKPQARDDVLRLSVQLVSTTLRLRERSLASSKACGA